MKRETKNSKLLSELKDALDEDQGTDVEDAVAKSQETIRKALEEEQK